jgi:general secretion pathway protein J
MKSEALPAFNIQHSTLSIDKRGFTLLELTISITLIGLIVLILVGAMRLGVRSVESGEKKIETLERMRTSFNILDSQIQSHIPLIYIENEEELMKYYFRGENNSLQFSTNYSIWGGQKGYVIVTYKVETDSTGKQYLSASENVVGVENNREVKLFTGFDRIYFEYFYKDPTEEGSGWIDQWDEEDGIPEKVKLHFVEGTIDLAFPLQIRVNRYTGTGQSFPGSSRDDMVDLDLTVEEEEE